MIEDDGGPAFPSVTTSVSGQPPQIRQVITGGGMTLRDWFAGQAMKAIIINPSQIQLKHIAIDTDTKVGIAAYAIADVMLKARKT